MKITAFDQDGVYSPQFLMHAQLIREKRAEDEVDLRQQVLLITGVFLLLGIISPLPLLQPLAQIQRVAFVVFSFVSVACAILGLVTNWGVRKNAAWARKPLITLATIGLCYFPLVTCFSIPILRKLHSRAEPKLLSLEYEAIAKATPEMNSRISVMTWIAIVLIIVLIVSIFVIAQNPPGIRHR